MSEDKFTVALSEKTFTDAYKQAYKAAKGKDASPLEVAREYKAFLAIAEFRNAPLAVPIFRASVSKKTDLLDWDVADNNSGSFNARRAHFYRPSRLSTLRA